MSEGLASTSTEADCGCPDFTLSRRRLLSGLLGVTAAGATTRLIGDVFTQVSYGAPATNPNVLVVLSLRGGADGLSVVVPHGDPAYAAARPRLGVPTGQLLAKDNMFGLHPALSPLLPMWQSGRFGAVHAVGLPQPNRSHFAAMEEVEDADPGSSERTGWLSRMIGGIDGDDPVQGVQLGTPVVPTSLYGDEPALSLTALSFLRLPGGSFWESSIRKSLHTAWGDAASADSAPSLGALGALETSQRLAYLADAQPPSNGATYPSTSLGLTLADTARLIRAQVGARVVAIDTGGWDMHTDLGVAGTGSMRAKLDEVAKGLSGFFTDLGPLAENVTVVTISEFGRRVIENGSFGLDHGYGNCILALGAGVNGGAVRAKWPGLGEARLIDGDLRVTVDYRSVLTEIIAARFPEISLAAVFPGFTAEPVGIA